MKDIASIGMVNEILRKYDLKAQKRYGQNFLIDANIVDKIAKNACSKECVTIEIGPGIGSLTQMLLKYSKKVYAHEVDEKLIGVLNDLFVNEDKLEIIKGDFLKIDFKAMPYYHDRLVVCANLPYYITTPILFKLFESDLKLEKITVMVQKEVADRFKAMPNDKDYNALSVIVQYLYDVEYLMKVSKNVFNPKPNVDSAVISFIKKERLEVKDEKRFFKLVKDAFKWRRKTLYNNLKDDYDDDKILKAFKELKLKDAVRAQELDLRTFIRLDEVINDV